MRPIKAVEYKENIVEIMTDVKISAACLFTSWKNHRESGKERVYSIARLAHYGEGHLLMINALYSIYEQRK